MLFPLAAGARSSSVEASGGGVFQSIALHQHAIYKLRVRNADAPIEAYCVRFGIERRQAQGWRPLGSGVKKGLRTCVEQAPQPQVRFNARLFPTQASLRHLAAGSYRLRAFSNQLDTELIFQR